MKVLVAAFLIASIMLASSEENRFYLGTATTETSSKGIYTGLLNSETGAFGKITLAAEADNPTFLAISPCGSFVYAALEASSGAVGAFRVADDGKLVFLNSRPSGGEVACHVSLDSKRQHLFVANYSSGNASCLGITSEGMLGETTAFAQFPELNSHSTPTKSRAHAVYADPKDRHVYVCDLGADKIWEFNFEAQAGDWTPMKPSNVPIPQGAGPRHLALHPSGRFAYVNNEMGLSVTALVRNAESGQLTPLETVPVSEKYEGITRGVTTSEIICHPQGRWLYVSLRGDDSIAVFRIENDGHLTLIQNVSAEVKIPRGMALDPSGQWLVVAGQKDNRLVSFAVDPTTGMLSFSGNVAEVPAPVCVSFVPKSATDGAPSP